jgi:simple sugar transport system permease protein
MSSADEAVGRRPPDRLLVWQRLRAIILRPELTALVSTAAVFAFFAINAGDQGFLTFTGTRNYLQVAAEIGIIASPITLLLVAGEFDLSVGTMVGAAGIAVAYPIVHLGWPLWAALLSGFLLAAIVGCANGLLIVRLGIPSFLATLGMMFFLRGLTLAVTLILTGTTQIYQLKDTLRGDPLLPVFAGTIRGMPVSIFWWLGLVLLCAYLLSRTRFGNWIYASGGDRDAAIKMGVPVETLKICLYVATAAAAVLVAVVNMLFADMAEVAQGVGKEFEAIVAAVVGGAATTGGLGSPIGTAIGTLMFGMISQGFFYTNINDNWFYSFVGAVLVLAVVANKYARDVAMRQGRRR